MTDFTGSHRHVIDYLTDEVLAGLPESVQHFLLHTSILDRLSVSLCALVMDRETSEEVLVRHQALLEELERNNLFVEALDDRREWYRYHHLFAEALRHRLQQSLPGCLEEAHLRASDWFEDHGFVLEAIEHALAAAAFERSADLIERLELMLFQQSANETLRRLLIRVPEPILVRHPTLCVTRAWFLLDEGHRDEGERWLDVAEGALQAGQGRKDAQDVQGEIAAARAYAASFRGDAAEVASLTDAALRDLRRNSLLARGLAHLALARGFMAQGEFDRAARSYADAAAIGRRTGNAQAVMRAAFGQSQMERAQGQLRRAMETCRQTIAWSAERGHPYPGVGMMHLALADLHRERNELDRALRMAAEGVDLCRRVEAEPDARVYPRFVLARIEQACGRLDAALDVVHNVQALVETSEPARSRSGWQAFEAQLWLRKGNLAAAVACAERAAREKIQDDLTLPAIAFLRGRENTLLVPIQILIAQGSVGRSPEHLHEALSLLDERRRSADKNRAVWVQIKTRVLEALAHHSLGETAQARASLEEALALGEPEWYVRVIADEGKPVADLLCEIPVTGVSSDYVAALLSAIHPTH